jgi:4-carboxymuconolactone decarboxylase
MFRDGAFDRGLAIRKEVLGEDHVEQALERVAPFSLPMQELVTELCWGTIWARPELGRRERSLINLAMLTALNRSRELGVHVRGAVSNGCTKEEIQETLLQVAVYCGVPAGIEAFRVAEAALAEIDHDATTTAGATGAGGAGEDGVGRQG